MRDAEAHGSPQASRDADIATDLLVRVGGGDREAFAALYDQVSARVHGLVLRVLADRAQSEEVAQDVLVEVWQRAGRFDPQRGTALGWIFTIAHRRAVDRVRSSTAQSAREAVYESKATVPSGDPTAEEAGQRVQAQQVRGVLGELSEIQREALELAYLDGCTHREVADRLGIPLGTAKTRIRDGMIALRRTLSEGGEWE